MHCQKKDLIEIRRNSLVKYLRNTLFIGGLKNDTTRVNQRNTEILFTYFTN